MKLWDICEHYAAALRKVRERSSPDSEIWTIANNALSSDKVRINPGPKLEDAIARLIDPEAWTAIKDGRDANLGSLWYLRREFAQKKASEILTILTWVKR